MAGTKRKSEEQEIRTRQQLLYSISQMNGVRDKALAAFIYLTGARISEILGHKKTFTDGRTLIIEPLKKENVELIAEEDLMIIHNVPCLKQRDRLPRRNIPIIITQELEFLRLFMPYYNILQEGQPLFNITRQRAWQIVNKELNIYNHFLIHERCTHLVTIKNFTDIDLMRFRGWKNTTAAAVYTHLNYKDIAAKMR